MHSYSYRANAIFCYACVVVSVMTAANIASTYWLPASPTATVEARVERFGHFREWGSQSTTDQALLRLDLTANLTSVFNWNTHMVYLWVQAEYESKANVR